MSLTIELRRIQAFITPDLYKKIEARAGSAHRSISAEIAWELEQFANTAKGAST